MGPHPAQLFPLLFLLLLLCLPCTPLRPQLVERTSDPEQPQSSNSTPACAGVVECKPGILLPVWLPANPPVGEQAGRAVLYFLFLMYMFLGVSIIADRFMASIEVITSQVTTTLLLIPTDLCLDSVTDECLSGHLCFC